jgi:alpha-ketoglutarate-dependent taurine dioxygenase
MSILKCNNFSDLKKAMPFEGLLLMEGLSLTDESLLDEATKLSSLTGDLQEKLLHWEFGPLMTMKFERDAQNYLFSDERVPFHWDGAFHKEPRHLLFYCTESEGEGGETLFTDTEKLWQDLSAKEKKIASEMKLIFRTEKKAHYGGEIIVPVKQVHPAKGTSILRVGEEVETALNPVSVQVEGSTALYQELKKALYSKEYLYAHQWKKGDLLMCDNFTFLHGRNELKGNLKRSFKRIQIL